MQQPRWNLLKEGCGKSGPNVFFAGAGFDYDLPYDVGVRKRLLSWHANSADDITQYVEAQAKGRESFGIVDSGAFTVWNKGGVIKVAEYIRKLIELLPHFDVAANLDVIPGKKGMAAADYTPEITEKAALEGWKNYLAISFSLKAHGIDAQRIMPIYHQGESMDWLKKMVDHGATYIGISPSNDYATAQRQHWLDEVFDYLRSLPAVPKTHGYAVTSPVLMKQYPWFSVDSASWVQQGGYGQVSTPMGLVTLTDRESMMGKADAMHGRGWSPEMKTKVTQYFIDIGLDIEEVKKSHHERWKANAIFMLGLEESMEYKPRQKVTGLFDTMPSGPAKDDPGSNELKDCFGLRTDDQLGEVPMSMHSSLKPKQ